MKTSIFKRIIVLSGIVICCSLSFVLAQQNLVLNPSFEEYDACPNDQGQAYNAKHWNSFGNSPDYFNSCAPSGEFSTPLNVAGWQMPKSGSAYIGGVMFYSYDTIPSYSGREFIGTKLMTPLSVGEKYFVSFFVSLQEIPSNAVCNKLGVLFTTKSFAVDSFCPPPCSVSNLTLLNNSQVYTDSIISDTLNWVKISGSFTADSSYEYLIVGNFFSNPNLNFIPIDSSVTIFGSYYYVDDVSVSIASLVNDVNSRSNYQKNQIIQIQPNPVVNTLNISLPSQSVLVIYDALGKKIHNAFANQREVNIDVSRLPNGVYVLSIQTTDIFQTVKFLIQK